MANEAVLCLFYVLAVFPKGLTSVIQTEQTVIAAVGEEAHFRCQLVQRKDVLQVTWQKILPEGEKNMATNNKYFGQRVNNEFRDKIEFEDVGLQNSSIVIRKVKEQDEGCYRCLFNTYPHGALSARTCLQLYVRSVDVTTPEVQPPRTIHSQGLHEPILDVRESNSAEDSVASFYGVILSVVLCFVLGIFVLGAVIYVIYKQKNKIRDPEKIQTPQKSIDEIVTPLIKMGTDQVKQRTSTKKSSTPNFSKLSPSRAKCVQKLFN